MREPDCLGLVADQGLRAVTMSRIAQDSGIGRATLYKYFPTVEAILLAWHERQIHDHLDHLAEVRDRAQKPADRLDAVLEAYALLLHETDDSELAAFLHRADQVVEARQQLHTMIRDLVANGATSGDFRIDVSPAVLASYCLHALTASKTVPLRVAVRRLVGVTLDGLRRRG